MGNLTIIAMCAFNFRLTTQRAATGPGGANRRRTSGGWQSIVAAAGAAILLLGSMPADAATVTTLGGAFAGDKDGNTKQDAQFNAPCGCALSKDGTVLYVADFHNGKIRKLDLSTGTTWTHASGLSQPMAVALDTAQNLYVLAYGNGALLKYDRYGSPPATLATFVNPTALTLDTNSLYVVEIGGALKRLDLKTKTVTTLKTDLNQPKGIALLDSGYLAIGESASHSVRILNPANGATLQIIGNGAGIADGLTPYAQFRNPEQLAKAPNGSLVLADRGNHRVRVLSTDGYVSTLYGIDPSQWYYPSGTEQGVYPGWWDGSSDYAEARDPVGVCVKADGTVFATEIYYHIVRQVTGTGLNASGAVTAQAVAVSPLSGYYPSGQTLYVTNYNTNLFEPVNVYYTTDGTEPTTASKPLVFANTPGTVGVATIFWNEPAKDLSSLRVKVTVGTSSATTAGEAIQSNQVGFSSTAMAGMGSRVVLPVIATLTPGHTLNSLQFRVEITPVGNSLPILPTGLKALDLSKEYTPNGLATVSAPFVAVKDSKGTTQGASWAPISYLEYYSRTNYDGRITRGAAVVYMSTNLVLQVQNFGTVAMVAVDLPKQSAAGDQYLLEVVAATGTLADGQEMALEPLNSRLVVGNVPYLVGDISTYSWYNAGQFGNRSLNNTDVRGVFKASMGIQAPFSFTDAFNAMDVFPVDQAYAVGGDSQIRYLDWIYTLRRSLRLDTSNWTRNWADGGVRKAYPASLNGSALAAGEQVSAASDPPVWLRQAAVGALNCEFLHPGEFVKMPVYVVVKPGYLLRGLQFRAVLTPEYQAPPLDLAAQFLPAALSAPEVTEPNPANPLSDWLFGWTTAAFNQPMTGSNLVGYFCFTVPLTAQNGHYYGLHFLKADGAPDLITQYDLESRPGAAWIGVKSPTPTSVISDEWKLNFFSQLTAIQADPAADPDGDGVSNLDEYPRGTNPVEFRLHNLSSDWRGGAASDGFKLRWFAQAGWEYLAQYADSPVSDRWTLLAQRTGRGDLMEVVDAAAMGQTRFYRVIVNNTNTSVNQ